ncbi:glycoside hydrolase family 6 protein [Nocardioides litoris]|uniref:glycoside hydrolase family 6 protein n=1 Tax=Nocardioides litoris TaxID=1926648 RepID=UPI0011209EAA|nr:glycoside hydrolase family 6 protein [Nocardioides litoris]
MRSPTAAVPGLLVLAALALAGCGGSGSSTADPPAQASVATSPAPTSDPTKDAEAGLARLQERVEAIARQQRREARQQRREARRERQERQERREAKRERREARNADNPLAGRPWGVYQGPREMWWEPWQRSSGETRALLDEIALQPKASWFGSWIGDADIEEATREYVRVSQAGDPQALVQVAMFRMEPWEHEACDRLPSAAEQASYRRWTDAFARGLGDAHAAVVLQPDGPFASCVPGGIGMPSELIAYSAKVLSDLPHTSVYIDGGAGDWPAEGQGGVDAAVDFLVPAGIEHARGIALNSTHYSATELEVRRGAALSEELAARGYPGKKVVINTSSNGNPFEFGRYTGPDPDNAFPCTSRDDDRTCVSLGIPPTTKVADPRWGLPDAVATLARRYVDGYLWFGRPWLYRQNSPFEMDRALQVVRSSPYVG